MRSWLILILALLAHAMPALAQDFGIPNEREPQEGVVFGGQPTQQQLQAMADAGFKTVIDLRGEAEDRGFDQEAATAAIGLEYLKIPVTTESAGTRPTYDSFFQAFREAQRPVLVHCASGNRVGALYYAWLASEKGLSRKEALEKAKANGLRSEALEDLANAYLDGD